MLLSPSPSLQLTLKKLVAFARLATDWDAQGSPPPSPIAIAEACRLLVAVCESAPATAGGRVLPDHVAPIPGGGVLLEWRGVLANIEVEIAPDGALGYLQRRGDGPAATFAEEDGATWDAVLDLIGKVIGAHDVG